MADYSTTFEVARIDGELIVTSTTTEDGEHVGSVRYGPLTALDEAQAHKILSELFSDENIEFQDGEVFVYEEGDTSYLLARIGDDLMRASAVED